MSVDRLKAGAPPRSTPFATSGAIQAVRPQIRASVRQGLLLYFAMVIFEGILRKWLLPGFNQYIYVAKDAVLAFLCLRVVLSLGYIPMPKPLRRTTVGQLFVVFAVYSFVQGFNFNLPNVVLGIWGIRTYVLPMSLVYLVPIGLPDPRENERLFRYYLLLGIPIAILCFVQYRLPATHFLNQYSNVKSELGPGVAMVGDAVRVSGPFSYISGLSIFMAFESAGLLAVLFASRWRLRGNMLIWLSLLLTIGVIAMSGSRAIVCYFILYLLIVAGLGPILKQGGAAPYRMVSAGICIASLTIGLFGDAFDRLAERHRLAGDTRSRLNSLVLEPIDLLDEAGLFGFGAAASHQAAPVLVPGGQSFYWLPNGWVEGEPGRVMIELGGVGFLLYMALKLAICVTVYNYIRRYGQHVPLVIPTACLLTAASCMVTGMLFSSVGSSFYWGMFGLFLSQASATRPRAVKP
jgi:hypothetical protein